MFKLENLEQLLAENERFLGYVLPLRIQEAIFKCLEPIKKGPIKDKELSITLFENIEASMEKLVDKLHRLDE